MTKPNRREDGSWVSFASWGLLACLLVATIQLDRTGGIEMTGGMGMDGVSTGGMGTGGTPSTGASCAADGI